MSNFTLVIGNKNYSSWSLRPFMALSMAGVPFEEVVIPLDQPRTKQEIIAHSKAGRVPVLHHGKLTVWDSLAILEYLAEVFPEKSLWPRTKAARVLARSVSSEMHSGFSALRNACPMNLRRPRKSLNLSDSVKTDIQRIEDIWRECRMNFGKGGKFLFGKFCNADSMFTPVVTRFDTYDIKVAKDTRQYMDNIMATSAFRTWKDAALKEQWRIPHDEVD